MVGVWSVGFSIVCVSLCSVLGFEWQGTCWQLEWSSLCMLVYCTCTSLCVCLSVLFLAACINLTVSASGHSAALAFSDCRVDIVDLKKDKVGYHLSAELLPALWMQGHLSPLDYLYRKEVLPFWTLCECFFGFDSSPLSPCQLKRSTPRLSGPCSALVFLTASSSSSTTLAIVTRAYQVSLSLLRTASVYACDLLSTAVKDMSRCGVKLSFAVSLLAEVVKRIFGCCVLRRVVCNFSHWSHRSWVMSSVWTVTYCVCA